MKNTTLCYIENDGCYLMLHRNKNKQDENIGKWIGVGGKFENGESPEECMHREVLEETGLKVNQYSYRGIVTFDSDCYETEYMHLFTVEGFEGRLTDCDEGELRWVPKNELCRLPMWEGDRIFLKLIEDGRQFFSLKLSYCGQKLVGVKLDGKVLNLE